MSKRHRDKIRARRDPDCLWTDTDGISFPDSLIANYGDFKRVCLLLVQDRDREAMAIIERYRQPGANLGKT